MQLLLFWQTLALEMMRNYAVDDRVIAHAIKNACDRAGINAGEIANAMLDKIAKKEGAVVIYVCGRCLIEFDRVVWHCPVCAHHWLPHERTCPNCHAWQARCRTGKRHREGNQ